MNFIELSNRKFQNSKFKVLSKKSIINSFLDSLLAHLLPNASFVYKFVSILCLSLGNNYSISTLLPYDLRFSSFTDYLFLNCSSIYLWQFYSAIIKNY